MRELKVYAQVQLRLQGETAEAMNKTWDSSVSLNRRIENLIRPLCGLAAWGLL